MRQTKLKVPLVTSAGVSVGIVGILAQRDLPPHPSESPYPPISALDASTNPAALPEASTSRSAYTSTSEQPGLLLRDDLESQSNSERAREPARTLPPISRQVYATAPVDKATTNGRKLALILHGALSHKDQTYHKLLVRSLPFDSFRFDFRSNAETPGTWSISGLNEDLEDLNAVVHHLRAALGYTIEVIVGHSRGSIDGFAWFTRYCPDSLPPQLRVPYFVALSTRYNMANIHERNVKYIPSFKREGFYRLQVRVAGEEKEVRIYPEQIEQFAAWPTAQITRDFPHKTDVLLVHGTVDKTVPVTDVASYANMLSGTTRRPGSCVVQLVEHADHNFRGFYPQLVAHIVSWLEERAQLGQSGLSAGAIRDAEASVRSNL